MKKLSEKKYKKLGFLAKRYELCKQTNAIANEVAHHLKGCPNNDYP
jgi:hypothetical protein